MSVIAIVAIVMIGLWKLVPQLKGSSTADLSAYPKETAKGEWVAVVHRNQIALWFDSGVNDTYVVEGDYGEMHIEVKDGSWHIVEVDCPNHTCEQMGWDNGSNFMPITCIPNNIFIGTKQWVEDYIQ